MVGTKVTDGTGGKGPHIINTLAAVIVLFALIWMWPSLAEGAPAVFTTVTGIVTLYGVAFAIIELFRTKAAASLAASEAERASQQVHALFSARDATECQTCIENALVSVDEGKPIGLAALSRITKYYAAEFAEQYRDVESDVHRRLINLESYSGLNPKAQAKAMSIKSTLVEMNNHVAAHSRKYLMIERTK